MPRLFKLAMWLAPWALAGQVAAQNPDYSTLGNLLVQFYGYQRSGDKSIDNKNPFYKTSPFPHSTDALNGSDLSGGWYDAGDFVKFGLPFGYSVYCLLKGYDVFPRGYDDITSWDYSGKPDGIPDILGEVKIATDYMCKAVLSSSQIVVDVGDAAVDHQAITESGYANSQRTSPRTVYANCGADIAGYYAASLALMSQLYKPYDSTYAATCLAKARLAFQFGNSHLALATEQNGGSYYSDVTYNDKMACGAIELYRATKDTSFLVQARSFEAKVVAHYYVLSYANAGDLSSYTMAALGEPVSSLLLTDVAGTISHVVPNTAPAAADLVKGAYIQSNWGNAGNAAAAGFAAALAFELTGDTTYLHFARQQASWVAGFSPFTQSYITGYGPNAPTAPSHRNDVARTGGPNVRLLGAVLSGPTPGTANWDANNPQNSSWSFDGTNYNDYTQTEPALNYNAAMVGLIGFLRDYDNPPAGLVRITTALTATPSNLDLNTQSDTILGTLQTAMSWKITLVGRISKAVRTVTGTGTAIKVIWSGEADSGSFVAGEGVDVTLAMPNIATYDLSRSATSFFITDAKIAPFKSTDILVDDFEGNDTLNKFGAPWQIFTDASLGGQSGTNPISITQSILAGDGYLATKGMSIRLIGQAGAPHPFAGVRCGFNATDSTVSLGSALSVVFDAQSTAGSSLWVELEQSDITDGAYYSKEIDFASANWNRIRVPFSTFVQPAWKTAAKPLELGEIKNLRFTYYGTSSVRFSLDNVHIENLQIGQSAILPSETIRHNQVTVLSANTEGLSYLFTPPAGATGNWQATIHDLFGRELASKNLGRIQGQKEIRFTGLHLTPGMYFLRHTMGNGSNESIQRFLVGMGN